MKKILSRIYMEFKDSPIYEQKIIRETFMVLAFGALVGLGLCIFAITSKVKAEEFVAGAATEPAYAEEYAGESDDDPGIDALETEGPIASVSASRDDGIAWVINPKRVPKENWTPKTRQDLETLAVCVTYQKEMLEKKEVELAEDAGGMNKASANNSGWSYAHQALYRAYSIHQRAVSSLNAVMDQETSAMLAEVIGAGYEENTEKRLSIDCAMLYNKISYEK